MQDSKNIEIPPGESPLHERLAVAIEQSITVRQILPGERLPTHRQIARDCAVAVGTVTRAIELLTRRGIVRGETGRGTFVLGAASEASAPNAPIELAVNGTPPMIRPEFWAQTVARVAPRLAEISGGYSLPQGGLAHRKAFSAWLQRERLSLHADAIILTLGTQQGLDLAIEDLAAKGVRALATEAATYSGALAAARKHSLDVVGLPVDKEGLIPDDLDRVLREGHAQAVYVTPVAQNPLGCEMSEARVRAILAVAARHKAPVVEDDVYFAYRSSKAPALKEIAPSQVYYATSLSKSMTPLLRVGVLAPPADRLKGLIARHHATVWSVSPFAAAVAAELLTDKFDRTIAKNLRAEAQARRQLAIEILGAGKIVTSTAMHIWLPMESSVAERFARRALEHGVRVTSPSAPIVNPSLASGIRLCLGAPAGREQLTDALNRLVVLFSAHELQMM